MVRIFAVLYTTVLIWFGAFSQAQADELPSGGGLAWVCFNNASVVSDIRAMIENDRRWNGWDNGNWYKTQDSERLYLPRNKIQDILTVESLDLLHARASRNFVTPKIIAIGAGESFQKDYRFRIADRFIQTSPSFRNIIRSDDQSIDFVGTVYENLLRVWDFKSADIPDRGANCLLLTIIKQHEEGNQTVIKYDSEIFALPENIFSKQDKATSVIHEYIYRYARQKLGQTTSNASVRLTAFAITDHTNEMSDTEISRFIKDAGFSEAGPQLEHTPYQGFYTQIIAEGMLDLTDMGMTIIRGFDDHEPNVDYQIDRSRIATSTRRDDFKKKIVDSFHEIKSGLDQNVDFYGSDEFEKSYSVLLWLAQQIVAGNKIHYYEAKLDINIYHESFEMLPKIDIGNYRWGHEYGKPYNSKDKQKFQAILAEINPYQEKLAAEMNDELSRLYNNTWRSRYNPLSNPNIGKIDAAFKDLISELIDFAGPINIGIVSKDKQAYLTAIREAITEPSYEKFVDKVIQKNGLKNIKF